MGTGPTPAHALANAVISSGVNPSGPSVASWGKPSAEHGGYVSQVTDLGDAYELSGNWLDQICSGAAVRVPKAPDVRAFFARADLPPLLPDNARYMQGIQFRGEEAPHELRYEWTEVFLRHPDPKVIIAALECDIVTDTLGAQHTLAYLLTHGNPEIEAAAARAVWDHADRASEAFGYRTLMTVLAGRGMIPSGVDGERAKVAVQRLYAACPADLCKEQRDEFVRIAKEYFGAGVFGKAEATAAEQAAATEAASVSYVRTDRKPAPFGGSTFVYEVYSGKSREQARAFLETKRVDKSAYYIVVETPEGNVGRDIQGIYDE